jgi:simple sugar transport system permease protein
VRSVRAARLVPALAVGLGFALGAAVLALTGRSPAAMGEALLQAATGYDVRAHAWNLRHVGELAVQTMPIVLTGLSVGFAFRTGLFNIGAEGQLVVGALAAVGAGLWAPAVPGLHVAVVLLAGLVAGGLWGGIPGVLKARFNVHEVVVAIMLNYVALHLNNWAVVALFGSLDRVKTAPLPATALLRSRWLSDLTGGSRLNWGFVPVLLALLVYAFVLERTTFGFSLRAVGWNRDAARNAGMRVERSLVASMVVAGAFAGLAGAVITVGTFG